MIHKSFKLILIIMVLLATFTTDRTQLSFAQETPVVNSPAIEKDLDFDNIAKILGYEVGKVLQEDAAWCWFSYPQAIKFDSYTFFGYVNKSGVVKAARYNHTSKKLENASLMKFEVDDHNAPAFLKLASGKIAVFYARHGMDNVLRYRISKSVNGIDFGEEQTLKSTAGNVTYSQVHQFTTNGKILWFYRTGALGTWASRVSTDDGATWSDEKPVFNFPTQGYIKTAIRESGNVILVALSTHPDRATTDHNIYAAYITDTLDVKGTLPGAKTIGNIDSGSNLPIKIASLTKVYDWTVSGDKAWIWDVTTVTNGVANIVFSTLESQTKHSYKYASMTNDIATTPSGWILNTIVDDAGGTISDSREPSYSGGMSVYREAANFGKLFLSRQIADKWVIEEWTTKNNGATWSSNRIAEGVGFKAVRPQTVVGGSADLPAIWMMGKYKHYTDYNADFRVPE